MLVAGSKNETQPAMFRATLRQRDTKGRPIEMSATTTEKRNPALDRTATGPIHLNLLLRNKFGYVSWSRAMSDYLTLYNCDLTVYNCVRAAVHRN
jgi:hypothetical protein